MGSIASQFDCSRAGKADQMGSTYLVRQGQGQLDVFGDSLSISTALDRSAEDRGAGPQGRASEAEGAHCAMDGGCEGSGYPS